MKREILFKAKRIDNGEWVEGHLIQDEDVSVILNKIINCNEEYFATEEWRPVDPKTICQFTGFKDMNGVKIFEGDLIHNYQAEENEVLFTCGGWHFRNYHANALELDGMELESIVLSNIHDND